MGDLMAVSILVTLGMAFAGLVGFAVERAGRDRNRVHCALREGGACACKLRSAEMMQVCPRAARIRRQDRT